MNYWIDGLSGDSKDDTVHMLGLGRVMRFLHNWQTDGEEVAVSRLFFLMLHNKCLANGPSAVSLTRGFEELLTNEPRQATIHTKDD